MASSKKPSDGAAPKFRAPDVASHPKPRTEALGVKIKRFQLNGEVERLSHYVFRYPAKFHPPVARALLETYTQAGETVLDPFCGSGTLLVEASILGRSSIGLDVDPIATAVSRAKVHRYQIPRLMDSANRTLEGFQRHHRAESEYRRRMFVDLSAAHYKAEIRLLQSYVPNIPNLFHWFRHYVIIDLARIRRAIEKTEMPESHRHLLRVVFASIIRNSSNADPVPVSGLEVTAHMKKRDLAGRFVDPFLFFERAVKRAIKGCEAFNEAAPTGETRVFCGDALELRRFLKRKVHAVITSPPYHGAVDYYRRHMLEMFWLGYTSTRDDRLGLLDHYIGRPSVPLRHPLVKDELTTDLAREWDKKIRKISAERANAFRHYMAAMSKFFDCLTQFVSTEAPVVLVIGHSSWNNTRIPTTELFAEIAGGRFRLDDVAWYPVKNRYMSYTRHNNANIDKEYVLQFRALDSRRRAARSGDTAAPP